MPSLISSRQIAGHPTAEAIACASVVFPVPGGPLITTRVGRQTADDEDDGAVAGDH